MIINYKYGFAYVHIQKTAGTSITRCLLEFRHTKMLGKTHSFLSQNDVPDSFYKFTFVRNPWERLVSWYNMMIWKQVHNDFSRYLLENSTSFSEFLDCTEIIMEKDPKLVDDNQPEMKSIAFNQLDYITDRNGKICVDFIGRYENLQEDFNKVLKDIGLPAMQLKHLNKFDRENYRSYYTEEDIEKVKKLYKRDIEYFGYKF